jgi:hypothetical protein
MATRIDLAKRLLQRAADDEAAAKAMLPIESVADVIVGMLAQQAVEKSLKAVLSFSAVNFPFVHDIDELTVLCTNAGHPLPDSLRGADQLTPTRAPCDKTPRIRSWSTAGRRCAGPHPPSPGPAESSKPPRSRWHPRTRSWTEPRRLPPDFDTHIRRGGKSGFDPRRSRILRPIVPGTTTRLGRVT